MKKLNHTVDMGLKITATENPLFIVFYIPLFLNMTAFAARWQRELSGGQTGTNGSNQAREK